MNKSRGILIAGNWKMNHGIQETERFFTQLEKSIGSWANPSRKFCLESTQLRACLFPPFTSLAQARLQASSLSFPLEIGAQNAHWENKGAFTGEISGPFLQELGIHWVLVGHSERRQLFGETDQTVYQRAESLLNQGFYVILCIGETQFERESGQTQKVLARQIQNGIPKIIKSMIEQQPQTPATPSSRLIIAYEPVWAIGTGLTATPEQAEEAHQEIRQLLLDLLGQKTAQAISILYGGSVTPQNIDALLACQNVDGALVGGASLKPDSYLALLDAGAKALKPDPAVC